jgi:general stress protein YciG
MAIRPNDEERSFGADRERQREVSNENARSARPSTGENVARGEAAPETGSAQRARSNRGFASMDRSKQREIASKGGRAAHQKGTAHEFDSSEARAAGRKGGVTVSKNREHMAAIGRRGGEARGANRAARMQGGESMSAPAGNGQGAQRFQGDREVGLSSTKNGQPAGNAGGQGAARQSGNSLGGERNVTASSTADRNVERP